MANNKKSAPPQALEKFSDRSQGDGAAAKVPAAGDPAAGDPSPAAAQSEPTIQLDHFLQSCGVPTGGQAKRLIQSGEIRVNDQVETRRKKKLRLGDVVTLDGEEFEVAIQPPEEDAATEVTSED